MPHKGPHKLVQQAAFISKEFTLVLFIYVFIWGIIWYLQGISTSKTRSRRRKFTTVALFIGKAQLSYLTFGFEKLKGY